jgi:3-oxoacyl-[acyl-carrier protein] reductase
LVERMAGPTLTNRIALVTGASRGIGQAIAIAFAEAGADVAVNYRQRKGEAAATVAAVQRLGRRSAAFAADVSQPRDVAAMVAGVQKALGAIDILVNNAGIAVRHSLEDITEADFDDTIAVNLKSAFLCTQAVWPGRRARGWGRIVNISSGAARGAGVFGVHYNASKAGMEGLTRGYAARLLIHGITVNAVAPSLIDTEMVASERETIAPTLPMKRLGTSEEVAAAVVMVVTNAYMTGQTVHVNGGRQFN